MGKHAATIHAIANFGATQDATPAPATPDRCDWCGYKTEHLSQKPTLDGSSGDGRGYHLLCRRCVGRYNEEAKEYRASHAKAPDPTCPKCGSHINPDEGGFCEACFQDFPM